MMRTAVLAVLLCPGWALSQTKPTPPPPPDPRTMDRAALVTEVEKLRPLISAGAVTPRRPPGCTSPASRQFDFWLGEWDVSPSGSTMVLAESAITLHDQGCVILEEWRPFQGPSGHSINGFDTTDERWHQTWTDATGRRTAYQGRFENGVMSLAGGWPLPGEPANLEQRMNFQLVDAGVVRQWAQKRAADGGWTVVWDLTYRRRPGTR